MPAAAGPVNWAHQAGAVQSNGAVVVKSLNGGSYGGIGNPTGAVAKGNQNASTQPPTVIIQATGSQYVEAVPLLVISTNASIPAIPECPSGYSSVFARTGSGSLSPVFNVAGTRFSLSQFYLSGSGYFVISWFMDGSVVGGSGSNSSMAPQISQVGSIDYPILRGWAARLCTK